MSACAALDCLRPQQPFAQWLDPPVLSGVGPLLLRDAQNAPVMLRLLMSRGGYADIWLVGERRGTLAATGPGAGLVDDYAALFPRTFVRAPKVEVVDSVTVSGLLMALSVAPVDALIAVQQSLRWYCADMDDRVRQQDGWCVPRCISIVSGRFAAGRITQQQAAQAWGQLPNQSFDAGDAALFARFDNACRQWGLRKIVDPVAPVPVDYEWFASRRLPTVVGLDGHAYVCTGACDAALNGLMKPFQGVGVVNPLDGAQHWLTTDEFGDRIRFAMEAPGPACGAAP